MFELVSIINHSIVITVFVFVMMLLVDYFNVLTKGKMKNAVRGGKTRQYIVASFLGATPGCLGAFMNVSLYVHGLLTFGAIVGGMIATSGDEAFVMLTMFPREALLLFTLLFILGVVGGWLADKVAMFFNIVPCEECKFHEVHDIDGKHPFQPSVLRNFSKLSPVRYGLMLIFLAIIVSNLFGFWGPQSWSLEKPERIILISLSPLVVFIIATVSEHYLKEHVMDHIIRKHVWKIFLWTFFALFFVETGLRYWNLDKFVVANMGLILIISALIGLIPESGPHLVFVMMFANGLIPFSILLTSSIVQDGHGLLPLFSYTLKDSVLIKTFNLMFGLAVGVLFFFLGF